jgi:aminoglycoside phosphotransferase family enzyme
VSSSTSDSSSSPTSPTIPARAVRAASPTATRAWSADSASAPTSTRSGTTALVLEFLDGRAPLLRERADRIVDGHGDLLADDIFCLDDGPRLLHCLDFDDHLRHVDALDDAASLAMDLQRLGRPDLAETFLDGYAEFAADPAPSALRHHYVASRAVVRAKVALLRHDQGDPHAAEDAGPHLELA